MRRIDARRGTENFKALFPTEFELLAKNQQGSPLGPPSSGRGLIVRRCSNHIRASSKPRILISSYLKTVHQWKQWKTVPPGSIACIAMGHVRDKLRHRRRHHRFSPSRTQRQGERSAFVNSGRTDRRIRTGPSPFDAPKRRNDDGMCHVALRVTWHVPRAAA